MDRLPFVPYRIDRRRFLAGAAILGTATFLGACGGESPVVPRGTTAAGSQSPAGTAYRLSTRGRSACGACKAHAANKYFASSVDADQVRAHPGCDCAVLAQPISVSRWSELFQQNGGMRAVYDVRTAQG